MKIKNSTKYKLGLSLWKVYCGFLYSIGASITIVILIILIKFGGK